MSDHPLELIPSIDLLDGKVVRLLRGDYQRVTVYFDDPLEPARAFAEAGVRRLHVVDLNGARSEANDVNRRWMEKLVNGTPLEVQVGGGIRSRTRAEHWLALGVSRVVVGTAAIKDAGWVRDLAASQGGRMVIALDARDGQVRVDGWTEGTAVSVKEAVHRVSAWGVAAILYTNIDRDGTGDGPDVQGTAQLQGFTEATVIASGGVGSVDDLLQLQGAGVRAAVSGRAIYEKRLDVRDALKRLEQHRVG